MKQPVWLLREVVEALHAQLAQFGGAVGIRDAGLLASALARPENGKPNLFELAAAYCFGLVKNHPFVDGNKRIAFAATVVFLEVNGYEFRAPEAEAVVQVLGLAAGGLDEAGCARWLRKSSRKRPR